jgi:hypothetical protein
MICICTVPCKHLGDNLGEANMGVVVLPCFVPYAEKLPSRTVVGDSGWNESVGLEPNRALRVVEEHLASTSNLEGCYWHSERNDGHVLKNMPHRTEEMMSEGYLILTSSYFLYASHFTCISFMSLSGAA